MTWFPVDPTSVTPGWLSTVLNADVRTCRLEQIGIGVGLLGRVYRAHLEGPGGATDSIRCALPTCSPIAV